MTTARKGIVKYLAVAGHALLALVFGQPAQAQLTRAPDFTLQAALGGKDMNFSLAQALKMICEARGPHGQKSLEVVKAFAAGKR